MRWLCCLRSVAVVRLGWEGVPQGLKPPFLAGWLEAKAEALAYLEASAKTKTKSKSKGKSKGKSEMRGFFAPLRMTMV